MKWFWNPCRRHRRNICLLAAGGLVEWETGKLRAHLAECADCRKYHDEMASLAKPLAGWETNFAHVEPTSETRTGWANAIQGEARDKSARLSASENVLLNCWRELVWPYRQVWAGLAAVWVVILAVNLSASDTEIVAGKSPPPFPEMTMTFPQQEKLLAELMGPNEPRVAVPLKPFSPRPSSERRFEILTT